ncbi:uracil permease [Fusibacter tunisiensis]|uniref:Uracil permease n=1 Tax=Fusibacter tunisiensis TaxID=1008308 RepID=A0ABS2MMS2_9FIRM|nr:uracil permease [Fusibacter tunisiensis]MBM7560690.1 uracil permease [Fusibacter tunisiensis]
MSKQEIQVDERLPILKTIPLSFQHLFAMFGASVLIPIIVGVNPALQLLFNGIGTLLYIIITRGKIPAFLGPSAAFIPVVSAVMLTEGYSAALSGGIVVGIIFTIAGFVVNKVGMGWIDVLLPPAAMGTVVAVIGLILAKFASGLAGLIPGEVPPELQTKTIIVSMFTLGVAIISSVMFRGFLKVIPILIAVVCGYLFAITQGLVDLSTVAEAPWFQIPTFVKPELNFNAIMIIAPAALVVLAEHVGDLSVTEKIVGKSLIRKDKGLSRSYIGNGIGTVLSSAFGGLPVTTYGENVGVMALTKVYSVWVIGGAAIFSIVLSFMGKVTAIIQAMPQAVMGGVSILLFGMISASGLRMLIDSNVDYSKTRNLILSAIVLILGVGEGKIVMGPVELEGMGLATMAAILLSLFFLLIDKLGISNTSGSEEEETEA